MVIDDAPVPYLVGVFAARAVAVLSDPLHVMYPKLNAFLNRGPAWELTRLPSYWIEQVLLQPPEQVQSADEAEWLLELLLDGLRTSEVSLVESLLCRGALVTCFLVPLFVPLIPSRLSQHLCFSYMISFPHYSHV